MERIGATTSKVVERRGMAISSSNTMSEVASDTISLPPCRFRQMDRQTVDDLHQPCGRSAEVGSGSWTSTWMRCP